MPGKDIETTVTMDASERDLVHQPTALASSDSGRTPAPVIPALPEVSTESYARGDEIARGGLGRIVRATDQRLGRVVALKELRKHSPDAAARFVREAIVTARLQHPGIVPIYEAGRWADGEPFLAMRLVSGVSLAEAIAARPTLDERLALLPRVAVIAETIAYAHAQHVIHRDLKPHNVMCGEFGETVVIDWGLAKDLDDTAPEPRVSDPASGSGSSDHTVAGTVLGTPAYMPPEQARGELVDERADVYALGALLYHLLAGVAPYRSDAEHGVLSGPPPPLPAGVPRDLVAIVDKAMARERGQRYPSARELAEDLRRFQTGHLVSVREYTAAERLARWLRRFRAPVAVAAIALVVLAAIGALSFARVVRERDRASTAAHSADEARDLAEHRESDLMLLQARSDLDRDPTASLAWLDKLGDPRLDLEAADIAADATSRGVATHVLRLEEGRIHGLTLAGGHGWALGQDGRLFAFDPVSGASHVAWSAGENALALATTPDGRMVAVAGGTKIGIVTDHGADTFPIGMPVISLALDPGGLQVALGHEDGRVVLRTLAGGASTMLDKFGEEVRAIAFSPDGSMLAATSFDGGVGVYRVRDGAHLLREQAATSQWCLTWARDGHAIATGGEDGVATVWPLDGAPAVRLTGHTAAVVSVAFDPAGDRVATASRDHTARLWSRDGKNLATLAHDDQVLAVAATPDGSGWATAGSDHVVRRWDRDGAPLAALRGHEDFITLLAFAPDGATLASAGQDGSVRLWPSAADHEAVARGASAVELARAGDAIAAALDGRMKVGLADRGDASDITDVYPGDPGDLFGVGPHGRVVRFSDNGVDVLPAAPAELGGVAEIDGVVFGAGYDGKLWRWPDVHTAPVGLPCDPTYVLTIVRIPDSQLVATGGADGTVHVWDRDGRVERVLATGHGPVHHLAVSPDGGLLAAGEIYGSVVVWRVSDGSEAGRQQHTGQIEAVAFSDDSAHLASAGDDKLVMIWSRDGTTQTLTGHVQPATSVAFSHDGTEVASGGLDGTVHVWELATGANRIVRGGHHAARSLAFDAHGDLLVADANGNVTRWPAEGIAPPPASGAALRAWIRARTDAAIDDAQLPSSP